MHWRDRPSAVLKASKLTIDQGEEMKAKTSKAKPLKPAALPCWLQLEVVRAYTLLVFRIGFSAIVMVLFSTSIAAQPDGTPGFQGSKVAEPPTRRLRPKPVNAKSMLRWAAKISDRPLPVGIKLPTLIPVKKESLAAIVCPKKPQDCASVAAAYSIETGEIMYRAAFVLSDVMHRSYIVHEMVHYLQHISQRTQLTRTCHQILKNEREAYGVQAAYLRRHGSIHASQIFPRMASCQPIGDEEMAIQ